MLPWGPMSPWGPEIEGIGISIFLFSIFILFLAPKPRGYIYVVPFSAPSSPPTNMGNFLFLVFVCVLAKHGQQVAAPWAQGYPHGDRMSWSEIEVMAAQP